MGNISPMTHPAQLPIDCLLEDCNIQHTRRSGPGGQHRNKVETAIVIEHLPSGIRGEASERRSQEQNRQQALQRLRLKLALAIRDKISPEPSKAWLKRVSGKRISVSPQHEEFPALLAEALDTIAEFQFAIPESAKRLQISTSQLIKFLKIEYEALTWINQQRQQLGLSLLR